MATLEQVEEGIRRAHEAGNADHVRMLAEERKRMLSDKPSPGEAFKLAASPVTGLLKGAQDIAIGGMQALTRISGDEERQRQMDEYSASQEAVFDRLTGGESGRRDAGRFVGNMAASAPIPGGAGQTTLARIGDAAVKGAIGGAVQPSDSGEQQALQAAIGFGTAGLLDAGLGYAANKTANARAGNLALDEGGEAARRFADDQGLAISGDDLSKGPVTRYAGSAIDNMPVVGRGEYRRLQAEAADRTARDFIGEFGEWGQESGDKVFNSARRVLDDVMTKKRTLYEDAFSRLDSVGEVDLPGFRQRAAELLAKEQARGSQADQAVIAQLEKAIQSPAGPMSFWHSVRSDLGDTIGGYYKGDSEITGSRGASVMQQLKESMDTEFNRVANDIGGDAAQAWKAADSFYSKEIVPYKQTIIRRAVKADDHEAILNAIIGKGSGVGTDDAAKARALYGRLDPEGRDAVAYALTRKAYEKATTDGKPFHPAAFASSLEKMEGRLGAFLDPEHKAYLDGMRNYMRHIEAAGHYANNPPTGRQLYGAILAGATVMDPVSTGQVALGAQGLKLLFNTTRGKSLMLAMSRTTPESEAGQRIASEVSQYLARASAGAD